MKSEIVILIAEDDEGHAVLIRKNLLRSKLANTMLHFKDGQEILDFLFQRTEPSRKPGTSYLLLLDIRMPKVDGVEVLRQIKQDPLLCKMPVTMLTTTDDPIEVEHCHALGCNNYITKPVDYEKFAQTVEKLGLFFSVVTIPELTESSPG